jgi:hypothetical protein
MTPEQITLVQSSFERLGPQLPAMATRFSPGSGWYHLRYHYAHGDDTATG